MEVNSADGSDSVSCTELQWEKQVPFSVAVEARATHERDDHKSLRVGT